jgi:hypothetical protein
MVTPVITSLLLWLVDDMTTHRGNEHHAAASMSLHHVISNCLGADEGSGQVNVNETSEHLNVITFSRGVGASEEIKLDKEL